MVFFSQLPWRLNVTSYLSFFSLSYVCPQWHHQLLIGGSMIITPMDVTIVMFLSTLAGILLCEAYHLMQLEEADLD